MHVVFDAGVGHIECAVITVLNETVQRENTSIIIKINASSFEWCIVCLSKISLDKAAR